MPTTIPPSASVVLGDRLLAAHKAAGDPFLNHDGTPAVCDDGWGDLRYLTPFDHVEIERASGRCPGHRPIMAIRPYDVQDLIAIDWLRTGQDVLPLLLSIAGTEALLGHEVFYIRDLRGGPVRVGHRITFDAGMLRNTDAHHRGGVHGYVCHIESGPDRHKVRPDVVDACRFCRMPVRQLDGVWVDDTDGDCCSGDVIDGTNENGTHRP